MVMSEQGFDKIPKVITMVPAIWYFRTVLSASMEPALSPQNVIGSALPRAISAREILLQACRRECRCSVLRFSHHRTEDEKKRELRAESCAGRGRGFL